MAILITGKTEKCELHVLEREQSMISDWAQLGYDVKYYSQQIEYRRIWVTIKEASDRLHPISNWYKITDFVYENISVFLNLYFSHSKNMQ
jgi:hypothetical protein